MARCGIESSNPMPHASVMRIALNARTRAFTPASPTPRTPDPLDNSAAVLGDETLIEALKMGRALL